MRDTIILGAGSWTGNGPYYQSVIFQRAVADGTVSVPISATAEHKAIFNDSQIAIDSITGNVVKISATKKPIISIPVDFDYSEIPESVHNISIEVTLTDSTHFTGSITKSDFRKLRDGNIVLIVSIGGTNAGIIKFPSIYYDKTTNILSAYAVQVRPGTADSTYWGVTISGADYTVAGKTISGGGGGGSSVSWDQILTTGTHIADITINGVTVGVFAPSAGAAAVWGAITGDLEDQTDLKNALDGKLSLSGGAMTGAITLKDSQSGPSMKASNSNSGVSIVGGGGVDAGASFILYGKDYSSDKGSFYIGVNSGDGLGNTYLYGSGITKKLKWNDKELANVEQVAAKSTVSVSTTGTATEVVYFITVDGVQKKLPVSVWGGIGGNIVEQTDLAAKLNEKINTANIKTSWGSIPGDGNVPSEKLTKDTLDLKQDVDNLVTSLSSASDTTHYPSAKTVYDFVLEYASDFKGSVATKADLATITGQNINDWAIVLADETQSGKTTRYGWNGTAWNLQWAVNNTTFTSAQWDAIDSGITAAKVATYDGYAATIGEKQPIATLEDDVAAKGFTKNIGTITGIKMNGSSKGTSGEVDLGIVLTEHQDISGKQNISTLEDDVAAKGFTKNTGTIEGITMNGTSMGTSGVVDLGTVLTEHQDISGKQNKITYGTADPTGGEDGDVYIKYTA